MKNNILTSMTQRGDKTFEELPFNEIDALIFSSIIYQRFEDLPDGGKGKTFRELYPLLCPLKIEETTGFDTDRYKLWEAISSSKRFSSFRIDAFDFSLSKEAGNEEQFAGFIFSEDESTGYVVYRGTDESITGWKEDLNLGFYDEIPSERKALEFLEKNAGSYRFLIVMGHSKGGTLALYASEKSADETFTKIKRIYDFDAPGLSDSIVQNDRWNEVKEKTEAYVPTSSYFGILFNYVEPRVVKADSHGVWQHDAFNWRVEGNTFLFHNGLSLESRMLSESMRYFLSLSTKDERETLVEVIFKVLSSVGEENVFRLPEVIREKFDLFFFKGIGSLTDKEKAVLKKLLQAVTKAQRKGYKSLREKYHGKKK